MDKPRQPGRVRDARWFALAVSVAGGSVDGDRHRFGYRRRREMVDNFVVAPH